MSETLNYASPPKEISTRTLVVLIYVTITYPIFFVLTLYSIWLFDWTRRGIRPTAGKPGPQNISWFETFDAVLLLLLYGMLIVVVVGIVLMIAELAIAKIRVRSVVRIILFGFTWIGSAALLFFDPLDVVGWYFD